jgi:phospholipid transport system substrate-binding protein
MTILAFALSLALLAPLASPVVSLASAGETPEQFVERTSNDALVILRDKTMDRKVRIERLETLLQDRSDFATIGKLVLAANYRQFSDPQKKEFEFLLRRYLTNTYGNQIDNYANETVEVTGGRSEARGDYTVLTKLKRSAGADILVDYRLRAVEGGWRLIDVIGEGISLVSNLRSQFGEILTRGGPEKLLKTLREKNEKGVADPVKKA